MRGASLLSWDSAGDVDLGDELGDDRLAAGHTRRLKCVVIGIGFALTFSCKNQEIRKNRQTSCSAGPLFERTFRAGVFLCAGSVLSVVQLVIS